MASATFSPTTSRAAGPGSRLVVPGLVAFLVLAGIGGLMFVRASHRPAIAPVAPADSVAVAAPSVSIVADPGPSASAAPSASVVVTLAPTSTLGPASPSRPHPSAGGRPSASSAPPPAPPAPSCHVVSYFDADGNKHFRQECP
jgi:hypothetical protein